MKGNLLHILLSIILILSNSITLSAQKLMKIDPELLRNSFPLEAKRKGIGAVGKYQFGEYRIISGKHGWTTTKSNSGFPFRAESNYESKTKLSFVFVREMEDTVLVNVDMNSTVSMLDSDNLLFRISRIGPVEFSGYQEILESKDSYIAGFTTSRDTSKWIMVVENYGGTAVEGRNLFKGILSNGSSLISLKVVLEWENGRRPMLFSTIGYQFTQEGVPIGAVQACIDTTKKKIVWIHKDLNENIQLILAAASAALIVRSEEQFGSIDD